MNDDGVIGWPSVFYSSTFFHGEFEGKSINESSSPMLELSVNKLINFTFSSDADFNITDAVDKKVAYPFKTLYHWIASPHTFRTAGSLTKTGGYFYEIVNGLFRSSIKEPRSNKQKTLEFYKKMDKKIDDGDLSNGSFTDIDRGNRAFVFIMKRVD
jgi:hypothetical protein